MPPIHNFQKADPQVYRGVVLRMVLLRCEKTTFDILGGSNLFKIRYPLRGLITE
jgi:hypothetical protein